MFFRLYHKLHLMNHATKRNVFTAASSRGGLALGRVWRWLACAGVLLLLGWDGLGAAQGRRVPVAATTGMVADLVAQVGGERVEVFQLMGPGVDPHLYKPTSADAVRLGRAEVIFYNGLLLEGRMGDLFARLGRQGKRVYALTEGVPEDLLLEPEAFEGHYDPHVWLDVRLWAMAVPVIVEALSGVDPEGRAGYVERGESLSARLQALHDWCLEQAQQIDPKRRILVTSHDAFNYFGRAYGFQVVALQGVSTVSEAALADVAGLVQFLQRQQVPAIFVESSVSPAALRRVAQDAGVRLGGELFSDAMGSRGEIRQGLDVGTYEGMVRYNMTVIVEALR